MNFIHLSCHLQLLIITGISVVAVLVTVTVFSSTGIMLTEQRLLASLVIESYFNVIIHLLLMVFSYFNVIINLLLMVFSIWCIIF